MSTQTNTPENAVTFNDKLGSWLEFHKEMFENSNIQENIYDLIQLVEHTTIINEDERELQKQLLTGMLKLSFVLNNNPKETEKLISYLLY